ncbi:MAG: hypothetical protein EPO24_01025 [Bacteroidetes bacterium]|nr:MAG: hypothetical protein EPO24_01025 [Bacteroidota bacterium]
MPECYICLKEATNIDQIDNRDKYAVNCPRCGKYEISGTARVSIRNKLEDNAYLLSAYCRERTYLGYPLLNIHYGNIESILSSIPPAQAIQERMDKLIAYIGKSFSFGEQVFLNHEIDYPICYLKSASELRGIISFLVEENLLRYSPDATTNYYMTLKGQKKYEELQKHPSKTNQAFVAMWFDKSINSAYTNAIKKAIEDSETNPKYIPLRIDLVEHNDPIDDRILVEIKKSRFIIADFTGHRGGVYFEAGYAIGLGIPVIWTCRKDEGAKMHFDTRQFSRIEWDNEQDLYEKLKRRIEGSIF